MGGQHRAGLPRGALLTSQDVTGRTTATPTRAAGADDPSAPGGLVARLGGRAEWFALLGPAGVLLVVGLAVLPAYRHHVGIDGVAYLAIAGRYADGELAGAVNAYWSPLLSWLAAGPIAAGVPPVTAGHLVTLGGGVVALVGASLLGARLGQGRTARAVVGLASLPFVLEAANRGVFADLLVAGPVLFAVALLATAPATGRDRGVAPGLAAGACLGVAALAKAVALPFAVGLLVTAWVVRRVLGPVGGYALAGLRPAPPARPGSHDRLVPAAAVALALVVAPWATALSLQAGTPTFGSAGQHNVRVVAPGSTGVAIHDELVPPADGQLFAWEDPSRIDVGAAEWSPDAQSAQRFGSNVFDNLGRVVEAARPYAVALLVAAVGALTVLRDRRTRVSGLLVLAAAGGWTAAHVLVVVEDRYLLVPLLCCLVLTGSAVQPLASLLGQRTRLAVAVLAAGLLVATVPASLAGLEARWGSGEETRFVSRLAAGDGVGDVRVASLDRYQRSSILCLHAGCRYWGVLDDDGMLDDIADQRLGALLDWGSTDVPAATAAALERDGFRATSYGEVVTVWLRGG